MKDIRTIRRDDWHRVLEKKVLIEDFRWKDIPGKISLLRIDRVSEPLFVSYSTGPVKIVDAGWSWVQIALEGQFYWITSMFDETDRLVQIYIDITDGNVTDTEDPWFADLYLDYVIHIRDDAVIEMDRDELDAAFRDGAVTRTQYERTISEGEKMLRYLREDRQELIDLLIREQSRLKRLLTD